MKAKYMVLTCAVALILCGAAVSYFGYRRQAETLAHLDGNGKDSAVEQIGGTEKTRGTKEMGGSEMEGDTGEVYSAGQLESEGQKTEKNQEEPGTSEISETESEHPKDYIKWVDFDVTVQALEDAYQQDVDSYGSRQHLNWIELLSYLATKYGGDFSRYKTKDMEELVQALLDSGQTMAEYAQGRQYYPYYLEAYTAVLGEMVGEYEIEVPAEGNPEKKHWEKKYGLRTFSPVAKGYEYSDYDDFGVARSYGYRRQHLGHDMMGQTGTPDSIKNYIKFQPCYNS